jgi:APA family basic amino acid/polyamine antiporter
MAFSMARRRDFPAALGRVHPRFGTPYVAIWIVGLVMTVVVLFADLTSVIAVSTFGLLFSYVWANISALKLKHRRYPRVISVIGLVSSLSLLVFIYFAAPNSWLAGVAFLGLGAVIYLVKKRRPATAA